MNRRPSLAEQSRPGDGFLGAEDQGRNSSGVRLNSLLCSINQTNATVVPGRASYPGPVGLQKLLEVVGNSSHTQGAVPAPPPYGEPHLSCVVQSMLDLGSILPSPPRLAQPPGGHTVSGVTEPDQLAEPQGIA